MNRKCHHPKIYDSGVSVNSAHYDPETEILWIEARCLPFIEESEIEYALVHKKHFDAIHAAIHAGDEPEAEPEADCCGNCYFGKNTVYPININWEDIGKEVLCRRFPYIDQPCKEYTQWCGEHRRKE